MTGFDLAQARYDGATPANVRDLSDEVETLCLGSYPETDIDDAYLCEARTICYMCGGMVCSEHDEVDDCDGEVVHAKCHRDGCGSAVCAEDARDAYLEAQDDADHGR